MAERILICGSEGYIGKPLTLSLEDTEHSLYPVDNGGRDEWVDKVGGRDIGGDLRAVYDLHYMDLTEYKHTDFIMRTFKPTIVIHLASQPSAPYSQISPSTRKLTQVGNMQMMSNLLCAAHENGLDNIKWVVTTTTGIPGAPKGAILEEPMANLAGSAYHASRGFDSANLNLAARQWGFRVLELRTAIVYGTQDYDGNKTRLDWDYYFGTVIHRFALRAKMGLDIPIYGKGEQKKPIICLKDVVKSLQNAITYDVPVGHTIMNQVTECLPIIQIAEVIADSKFLKGYLPMAYPDNEYCKIKHIPNPRVENEEHQMEIKNEKFLELLNYNPRPVYNEIHTILEDINTQLLPKDWERVYNGG